VALRRRGFVSVGAAVACCALAAACTPQPAPISTTSPTPTATTPTESQIERQMRLDYEAAEKAYRANKAEQARLYLAGGTTKATSTMRATATGSYLRITLEALQRIRKVGWQASGTTEIVGVVANGGWREKEVGLTSCEDSSVVRFHDRTGKDVTPSSNRRYVQVLKVVKRSGQWKVSEAISTRVTNFEGQPCQA
jgi:hypothetical protein